MVLMFGFFFPSKLWSLFFHLEGGIPFSRLVDLLNFFFTNFSFFYLVPVTPTPTPLIKVKINIHVV